MLPKDLLQTQNYHHFLINALKTHEQKYFCWIIDIVSNIKNDFHILTLRFQQLIWNLCCVKRHLVKDSGTILTQKYLLRLYQFNYNNNQVLDTSMSYHSLTIFRVCQHLGANNSRTHFGLLPYHFAVWVSTKYFNFHCITYFLVSKLEASFKV